MEAPVGHSPRPSPEDEPGQNHQSTGVQLSFGKMLQGQSPCEGTVAISVHVSRCATGLLILPRRTRNTKFPCPGCCHHPVTFPWDHRGSGAGTMTVSFLQHSRPSQEGVSLLHSACLSLRVSVLLGLGRSQTIRRTCFGTELAPQIPAGKAAQASLGSSLCLLLPGNPGRKLLT